ncbi:chromosome partitioning protein ParB [Sulfitobacter sp. EhC04]|uniref:ParB/RepB/Spo0J family partition protein n=1 Tax=Sulfitobacter sp. EhC04 TaxID=1849168 RepID=UPI0007F5269C|nr:ParB N-terminal domain-containing protein [Sulfitobacter sp. EhC04]OAN75631.1 chromosome partitioning protein ParB [Sulfitobacter sp. EhC04]
MAKSNKFGFAPLDVDTPARRERSVGPMGAAVREAAESLTDATDAKVEKRRQNAKDAEAFRAAQDEGRVLIVLELSEISTDDLPRDRMDLDAVAVSDEMEELKASIRERGQKEPIEVYRGPDGSFQLKKGWRRFTALSQLLAETGDDRFGTITARVEQGEDGRLARYIDMVEENVVREDLTFAEMAQVVITAAHDDGVGEPDPDALVARLYGSLHKMKKSYIRSFVFLLSQVGDALPFPKAISRNLGVDVSRAFKSQEAAAALREQLLLCQTADEQNKVLSAFVDAAKAVPQIQKKKLEPREKFEFHVGSLKVTARRGECRIVSKDDFAALPKPLLERAIKAFEDELRAGPGIKSL